MPEFEIEKTRKKESNKPVLITQHPKGLADRDPRILATEKPYYLTKRNEVDIRFYNMSQKDRAEAERGLPENPRCIRASFIGLPNAGKSSLVNALANSQVSAVSKLSYTTHENTVGVHSDASQGVQSIFIDTPGIIDRYKIQNENGKEAWKAVQESDMAVFVIDGARRLEDAVFEVLTMLKQKQQTDDYSEYKKTTLLEQGRSNQARNLGQIRQKLVLVINKIDFLTGRRKIIALKDDLEDVIHFDKIFLVSAETGFGIDDLRRYIQEQADEGPWEFEPGVKSEVNEADKVTELMRETLFNRFYQDIPFRIAVKVTQMAIRSDGVLKIHFHLRCFSQQVVPMILGERGRNLKWMIKDIEAKITERYGMRSVATISVSKSKFKLDQALRFRTDLLDDEAAAIKQVDEELGASMKEKRNSLDPRQYLDDYKRQALVMDRLDELKDAPDLDQGMEDLVKEARAKGPVHAEYQRRRQEKNAARLREQSQSFNNNPIENLENPIQDDLEGMEEMQNMINQILDESDHTEQRSSNSNIKPGKIKMKSRNQSGDREN